MRIVTMVAIDNCKGRQKVDLVPNRSSTRNRRVPSYGVNLRSFPMEECVATCQIVRALGFPFIRNGSNGRPSSYLNYEVGV